MIRAYPIREPNHGVVVAVHKVPRLANGKRDPDHEPWWEGPDGQRGIKRLGLAVEDLPLYGAAAAHRWNLDLPVIVVEGEGAASALVKAGWQAVGTFGASACPSRTSLMILAGHRVLLWPDADQAGVLHMLKVARALGEPGDIVGFPVGWLVWDAAPPGGDAADYLAAGLEVAHLVTTSVQVPVPPAGAPRRRYFTPPRRSSDVSDALAELFGLQAVPGRGLRCPKHEDRHPSLSIAQDNKRAWCHSPSCEWNNDGRGVSAWQIRNGVTAWTA